MGTGSDMMPHVQLLCLVSASSCLHATREIPSLLNVASAIPELFPSLAVIAVGSQWGCWQEQDICSFWWWTICECLRLGLLCFSSWRAPGAEEDFHTAAWLTSRRCEMRCQLLSLGEKAASAKYTSFGTATPDCHIIPFADRKSQNHLGWKTDHQVQMFCLNLN